MYKYNNLNILSHLNYVKFKLFKLFKLFKGNVIVLGRKSQYSIYSEDLSTFEADSGDYDQRDAEGFIKVNSLRLRNKQK